MLKDKKLKESLKGVFDGEIKVYDIDKFFHEQGVLVTVHAGRYTGRATLNPKLYGVDITKDEELTSFRDEYIKGEKISFLPASIEKRFISIESATRIAKKQLVIGLEGKYMPIESFKEFSLYFKEQKEKYQEVKKEVLQRWNEIRTQFVRELDVMLDKLNPDDKDELKELILSKAPSKESFEESCKFELEVLAFPTAENISILDDSLNDEIKDSLARKSLGTVYEILGNILSDSFDLINHVMRKNEENGKYQKNTLSSVDRLRERINKRNILRHPVIMELEKTLDLKNCFDDDEITETLECALALIYSFAKSIDVDIYLNMDKSFLSEKTLQDLSLSYSF